MQIPCDNSHESSTSRHYNILQLHNVVLQSIRYSVGLCDTAAITKAVFLDAELITVRDKRLLVDHNKIKKVMKSLDKGFHVQCRICNIECIFFDRHKDSTKVLLQSDNSNHQFPSIVKEEHYTVCSEPGGRYLCYFTPEKDLTKRKLAEVIANHLVDFLKKNSIDKCLLAIDSTNINTNWEKGVIHWVEAKLNFKLI